MLEGGSSDKKLIMKQDNNNMNDILGKFLFVTGPAKIGHVGT